MADGDFSDAEYEKGRLLFAEEWRFATAASAPDSLPVMSGAEIAVAGRSNVGKSTLINALTGRKALARTSNTPGRTTELIFFTSDSGLMLVDMPGYGYAAAPKTKISAWTDLIHHFLRGRANLARVYLLIDARRGLTPSDDPVLATLDEAATSYQIVLTKSDQIRPEELETRVSETQAKLAKRPAAYPRVLTTSARTGQGIPELRAAIARLMVERGI